MKNVGINNFFLYINVASSCKFRSCIVHLRNEAISSFYVTQRHLSCDLVILLFKVLL